MIPDFKTFIGESAWGEMRKRSSGEQIRKEDDINLLDLKGLCDYMNQIYEPTIDGEQIIHMDAFERVSVPIICNPNGFDMCRISLDHHGIQKGGVEIVLPIRFMKLANDTYMDLSNKYYLDVIDDYEGKPYYVSVRPKSGHITNQCFLDVVDFILNNLHGSIKPLIKKREK